MSEWDTFHDVYEGGGDDSGVDGSGLDHGDLDEGGLDEGGLDQGGLDQGGLDDAGFGPAAHDPLAHDPLAHDPLAHDPLAHDPLAHDPLAEQAPAPAEIDWGREPVLGNDTSGGFEDGPGDWGATLDMHEVTSGDPYSELVNETGTIEPGTPLWDTVMNVLALPGRAPDAWLQPGQDDFGTAV